jgi:hypothetical protein
VGGGQLGGRHPEIGSAQRLAIEFRGVLQEGVGAAAADVAADALDDLQRREGFAKDFNGLAAAGFADDVSLRSQLRAERGDLLARGRVTRINAGDGEGHGGRARC